MPSKRVIRTFEQVIEWRGKPAVLRCDNGTEYISGEMANWANQNHITLIYIQPSKPTQNAHIERFNRTSRHMNRSTCISLTQSNMRSFWQSSDYALTRMNDRIQRLTALRR